MKKILTAVLALVLVVSTLTALACTDKTADEKTDESFWIGSWERVTVSDTLYLNLRKDGSFSFSCACGSPVGDADCYDSFEYKQDEQVIRAYDSSNRESYHDYKLYMHGKNFIVIDVDGEIMEFWLKGKYELPENAAKHCAELIEGFNMFRYMTDISDTEITLVPSYYDGDVKEHREEKISLKLASDATFLSFDVFTVNKDGVETTTYEQSEMTLEDVKYFLDATLGGGFVWVNEDLEVTKILFYGELYNWE